jgi:hypothetical protein
MNQILHLVLETPGAKAYDILQEATMEDRPLPQFYFPNLSPSCKSEEHTWSLGDNGCDQPLSFNDPLGSPEVFIILSHHISLAHQLEAFVRFQQTNEQIIMGRILLFIHSPVLLEGIDSFQDWVDAVVHFTDAMLFTDRTNENASAIKTLQQRYTTLRYPLENYILSKKNNPWSRILDPTPRRLSHIFDEIELLEPEDYPENDRYLKKLPTGERERTIPLIFKK